MDKKKYIFKLLHHTCIRMHPGRISKQKACTYITIGLAILLILSVIVVLICAVVYSQCVDNYSNTAQLGCDNDTIAVGRVSSFLYSHVTVYECLKKNDYSHVSDIFLEEHNNLVTHSQYTERHSRVYDQPYPSEETGLVDYLYLLEGSKVEYTICLASETASEETGHLYIFDDQTKYWNYASNTDDGEKQSIYSTVLEIGASNQSICHTVHYDVTYATYLFIASRTPASIHYNYTLSTYEVFYNHDDYKLVCQTGGGSCNVELPGGFFHPRDFQILAYIQVPIAADPFTTHICMAPHVSSTFAVILLTSLFVACVLFLLVMCLTVFGVQVKRRQKRTVYGNHMVIN